MLDIYSLLRKLGHDDFKENKMTILVIANGHNSINPVPKYCRGGKKRLGDIRTFAGKSCKSWRGSSKISVLQSFVCDDTAYEHF